jgi:hypothetical protein
MNSPQIKTARMLQAPLAPGALLRNRWVIVAVAVLALVAIVAASWSWLVAALATILVSALPCLVVCGLGLCMHRFFSGSGSPQSSGSATADPPKGAVERQPTARPLTPRAAAEERLLYLL